MGGVTVRDVDVSLLEIPYFAEGLLRVWGVG